MQSADRQLDLLLRGVEQTHTVEDLKKRLEESVATNRPLRVKLGMDPTAPDLHLGHCVVLEKMRQFQDLGHKAVLIIGDYTAMIGDPTGRNETRPMLAPDQIARNAETYFHQAGKVLDTSPEKLEVRHNNEWFGKMTLADSIRLTSRMSAAQMLQRRDFKERFKNDVDIALSEFVYPLLQGWDSVVIRSDVELGGTDQLFNNLVGRELQKDEKQPPQIVMVVPILEGLDGVEKMSKSKGNTIGVTEAPKEMFGKTMSISDDLMWRWYKLLLGRADKEVAALKSRPMEAKKELGAFLVERFHDRAQAEQARADWEKQFQQKSYETVAAALTLPAGTGETWIIELIEQAHKFSSRSEARRMIREGGVSLDNRRITDDKVKVQPRTGQILKIGKRVVVKLQVGP